MQIDNRTPAHILADLLLGGGGLGEFVTNRRTAGDSWRDIELALITATDGKVKVTGQTLRMWFGKADPKPEDGAASSARSA